MPALSQDELTADDFNVGWNANVSAIDKEFFGVIYPENAQPGIPKLTTLVPAMEWGIWKDGEEGMFEVTVNIPGQCAIELGDRPML